MKKTTGFNLSSLADLVRIDPSPRRGLAVFELVVMAYLVLTTLFTLFAWTKLPHGEMLLVGRLKILGIMAAMWAVYRLLPCRLTMCLRAVTQMALLAWWYPDTYELSLAFDSLDHVFATWEQRLFGFQPALTFAATWSSKVVSELMYMGYFLYYPIIALVAFFYFFCRKAEFERCVTVFLVAFFAYYVVFFLVPVAGPMFYYKAIGLDSAAAGVFPAVGDYFATHTDMLPSPGWSDGLFYDLVQDAHDAGERPIAAFPSSHVSIATVAMLLGWHSGQRRLFWGGMPVYVLLCLSTVYIQAHYAIDAIAGFVSALAVYPVLMFATRGMVRKEGKKKPRR